MSNQTNITDAQIACLMQEAAVHGDSEQVFLCEDALDGDKTARAECQRVIDDAQAMGD